MNLLPVQFRCFTNCCFYARSQGEQVCMQRSLRAVSQLPMAFWIFLLVFKDRHFGAHLSDAHSKVWVAQYGAKLSHSSVRSSGFVRFPCCHTEGWVLAWLCLPLLLSVCGPFIICWKELLSQFHCLFQREFPVPSSRFSAFLGRGGVQIFLPTILDCPPGMCILCLVEIAKLSSTMFVPIYTSCQQKQFPLKPHVLVTLLIFSMCVYLSIHEKDYYFEVIKPHSFLCL